MSGRQSRSFFMPPRFFAPVTATELNFDADEEDLEYFGYSKQSISLDEWFGAVDPVQNERARLKKLHGDGTPYKFIHKVKK